MIGEALRRDGTGRAGTGRVARGWVLPALAAVAAITAIRLAFVAFAGLELDFEEAQYWFWSWDPAWGYFSKPPLIAWLIGAATALCGDGEACIRFPSPLIHAATAMAVGGIGAALGGAESRGRLALWSAIGYATLPGVSFSAFLMTTDVPLLLCWALALLAWVRLLQGDSPATFLAWAVIGGAALGTGLMAKYAMAYFLLCAVVHLALDPASRRRAAARVPAILVFLGIGLLLVAPNLAWNAGGGFITFRHTAENADLGGLPDPGRLLEFLGSQLAVFGPVLFVVLLMAPFRGGWRDDGTAVPADSGEMAPGRVLAAFCYPVLLLLVVQALLSRANANWAAPAYVAGTVLVSWWLLRAGRGRLLRVSLGLHLAAAAALYLALATVPAVTLPGIGAKPVAARLHGWALLGDRVAVHLAAAPGSVVVSEYRALLSSLIYYADLRPGQFAKWNSDRDVEDHYELSGRVIEAAAADGVTRFVIVSERPDPTGVLDRFDTWRLLEVVEVPLGAGLVRRHWLYEAQGFRGYAR